MLMFLIFHCKDEHPEYNVKRGRKRKPIAGTKVRTDICVEPGRFPLAIHATCVEFLCSYGMMAGKGSYGEVSESG